MTATLAQAAAFWREGDFPNAARACAAILASDPTHFDALHLLGVVCTNLGQAADGLAFLLRAAATGTDSAQLRSNLGVAYATLRRFDEATESYRRALEIGPRSAGALNNLGLALLERDDRDEAADMFQAALALDPAFHAAHYNLAKAWAASGRLAEAETISRGLLNDCRPIRRPNARATSPTSTHGI